MSERLLDYIRRVKEGGRGWVGEYEEGLGGELEGDKKYAYLTGHYSAMLMELIDVMSTDLALRLVTTHNDVGRRETELRGDR